MLRTCLAILAVLACTGTVDADNGNGDGNEPPLIPLRLQEVVSDLERPVYLTSPAGDSRLFIVEQPGRIRIVQNGQLLSEPFLDIDAKVESGGNEQGLLSVAFHPDYSTNGFFFVNYTDANDATRVERYSVSAGDPNRADAASAKLIIGYEQPFRNHNGGHVLFGADGMLYIPSGDGGSGGDPQGHGQNRSSLLGKILRIDVDGGDPYAVPDDNPFVGQADTRPEIWALGLRNPWRVAFDNEEDLLYVADVGQNAWEEISVVPTGEGGFNFGWNQMEGTHCFPADSDCSAQGLTLPVVEYPHSQGISITGGFVYRGQAIPELQGRYVYADFGQDWIRSFRYSNGEAQGDAELDLEGVSSISSFGLDSEGELYVLTLPGTVYKLAPEA
jgi:glucose/arabinose dehydrogenase